MLDPRKRLGNQAEALAARHLEKKGYEILCRQYRKPFGEIDLIAIDGDEVVFVEVKALSRTDWGYPEQAVDAQKIGRIVQTAEAYLEEVFQQDVSWRIDVVAVEMGVASPRFTHIQVIDIPEQYW